MAQKFQEIEPGEVGRGSGRHFQQIQKYEKGANRVSASRLFEIAKLLEVEVSYFFEGAQIAQEQSGIKMHEDGPKPPTASDHDLMKARQALELQQAYNSIDDPVIRHKFLELIKAVVQSLQSDRAK